MKRMLKVLTIAAVVTVGGLMVSPVAMARDGHGFRGGYYRGYYQHGDHGYRGHDYWGGDWGWYFPSFAFSYSYYAPPPAYYYNPPPVRYYSPPRVYYYSGGSFYCY